MNQRGPESALASPASASASASSASATADSDSLAWRERRHAARIIRNVRHAERRFRRRLEWLRFQDALGAGLALLAASVFVLSGAAYFFGWIPAWVCIPLSAAAAAILHEIEHDLIHDLYFARRRALQHALFALVWLFRPNTIHPWFRRRIHLLHHRVSGTESDAEERLITNGMPYGWKRALALLDGLLNALLRRSELQAIPGLGRWSLARAAFPMIPIYYGIVFAWIGCSIFGAPSNLRYALDLAMVVYVAPNALRQFSLTFISSSMHYYGDVSNLFRQTQVLRPWFLFPLQVFCFNFGSTHGIHHFVVNQPFYLRQMVAWRAHAVFRRVGVRFNDLGTFRRANRYAAVSPAA
jgi:fatty acid desaturase